MNKKLHIGNLPLSVTDEELTAKFAHFGAVNFAAVFKDNGTGISHGFGLVEMGDSAAALKAIEWLNFSTYAGQIMTVSLFDHQQVPH